VRASRSAPATWAASSAMAARGTGSATSSHPNGPCQADSRLSSSDGATRCGSGGGASSASNASGTGSTGAQQGRASSAPAPAVSAGRPRVPGGNANATTPSPLSRSGDAAVVSTLTGPPGCGRTQPSNNGAAAGPVMAAW
jgi:molecular chaperone HscA